jgi:fatty acid desaturase
MSISMIEHSFKIEYIPSLLHFSNQVFLSSSSSLLLFIYLVFVLLLFIYLVFVLLLFIYLVFVLLLFIYLVFFCFCYFCLK